MSVLGIDRCECSGQCGHDHHGCCPAHDRTRSREDGHLVVLTEAPVTTTAGHLLHLAFCQHCRGRYTSAADEHH